MDRLCVCGSVHTRMHLGNEPQLALPKEPRKGWAESDREAWWAQPLLEAAEEAMTTVV